MLTSETITQATDMWADLEGDFEAEARMERATPAEKADAMHADHLAQFDTAAPMTHTSTCSKCRGSGRFRAYSGRDCGACFVCKGEGTLTHKTSPEARAKARERAATKKMGNVEAWNAANPAVAAWIMAKGPKFRFASEMGAAVVKYGFLTEAQMATCARLMASDAERDAKFAADRAERTAAAPAVDVTRIVETMGTAQANGIKRPVLRLADFKFSVAPATGRNGGALYVKTAGGDYLGKIADGKFARAFGVAVEVEAEIVQVASDPEAAAVAYGKRFGSCGCCGRELSDPESVERGIGPVCAGKFGW